MSEVAVVEEPPRDAPISVTEGGTETVVVIDDGGGYTSGGGGEEAVAEHEAKPDPHPQYLTGAEAGSLYEPVGAADSAVSAHATAANPHPVYATDADLTAKENAGVAAGLVTAHEAKADPHPQYSTDADLASGLAGKEAAGAAASAVSAHVAAADPHTGYQKETEKGQASGYASLGADGKVPSGQLPAVQAGGVTDHGDLTGLSDPDHPIAAVIGLQTALDGKSATSHNHSGVYDPAGTAASSVAAHEGKADPHPQYLTPAEGTAAYEAAGAVTAHEAKADPHAQYLTAAEGTAAYEPAGNISAHNSSGAAHSALRSTFPPVAVDASTGAVGTGSVFARTDHKHQVTTAAPVSLGAANAAGTSNSLARADHVHQYPTSANVGAEPAGAVTAHEAKPNPHPQYMAQGGGSSGVVPVYADEDSLPAGEPGAIAFVTDSPDPDRHYYSYDPNSGWAVLGNANQKTMYWATEDGYPMLYGYSTVWFPEGTSLTGGGDGVHIGLPYLPLSGGMITGPLAQGVVYDTGGGPLWLPGGVKASIDSKVVGGVFDGAQLRLWVAGTAVDYPSAGFVHESGIDIRVGTSEMPDAYLDVHTSGGLVLDGADVTIRANQPDPGDMNHYGSIQFDAYGSIAMYPSAELDLNAPDGRLFMGNGSTQLSSDNGTVLLTGTWQPIDIQIGSAYGWEDRVLLQGAVTVQSSENSFIVDVGGSIALDAYEVTINATGTALLHGGEIVVIESPNSFVRIGSLQPIRVHAMDGSPQTITNVAVPTTATDVVNKEYADTKWTKWSGTQAAYDAIGTKDPDTLYVVVG